jgi:hypothetical protein
VLGSFSKLRSHFKSAKKPFNNIQTPSTTKSVPIPLNAGQDSSNIVRRTPSVLQNVQAQLAGGVYVGVEHLADEFDLGRLVGVLLLKLHDESECAIFKRCVRWAYDYGIPRKKRG